MRWLIETVRFSFIEFRSNITQNTRAMASWDTMSDMLASKESENKLRYC